MTATYATTQTTDQTTDDLHEYHPAMTAAHAPTGANPFATLADISQMQPPDMAASFSIAPDGTNKCTVLVSLTSDGAPLAHPTFVMAWLSDSAAGVGIVGVQPSTFAVTVGAPMNAGTRTSLMVQTDGTGRLGVTITDTTKRGSYVCVQPLGDYANFISRQLTTGDYG